MIIIYIIYDGYKEGFEVIDDIIYMTKEEIQIFIINDRDDYIKNMSVYDLRARKVRSYEEYISIISSNVMDFTEEQKEKLRRCCKRARIYFDNKKGWKFGLISSVYEEGFPHTREDIIFLSPSVLNYDDGNLTKTLIHESIHIYQRYNKREMEEYLIRKGYERIRRRERGGMIRSNPDLDEFIYRDKNGVEMVAIYKKENPDGIGDIKIESQMEHPFEYMAYEMAEEYYKSLMSKYKEL
jgi:hypothetical protein